ncbi:rodlin [Streptomyces sp. LHD-70]|uniref:rodlin n=1 Tax=Streptomyces sp. LHD-70 TaxID=3072140 RepID=UPI00280D3FD2|nr:rodlin [Streptomyces sp. LHD-70]MDQ8707210.1 rodlin [Streptomyces sp. LHD-70]
MLKKVMATAAVTMSVAGLGAAMAPQAFADNDPTSLSGNGASQTYGNSATHGDMSPQLGLVQGSLNKPCIGLPAKANVGSLIGLINVAVQDIPVLSSAQNQQCVENSTQTKGDDGLANVLHNVLSANAGR